MIPGTPRRVCNIDNINQFPERAKVADVLRSLRLCLSILRPVAGGCVREVRSDEWDPLDLEAIEATVFGFGSAASPSEPSLAHDVLLSLTY